MQLTVLQNKHSVMSHADDVITMLLSHPLTIAERTNHSSVMYLSSHM